MPAPNQPVSTSKFKKKNYPQQTSPGRTSRGAGYPGAAWWGAYTATRQYQKYAPKGVQAAQGVSPQAARYTPPVAAAAPGTYAYTTPLGYTSGYVPPTPATTQVALPGAPATAQPPTTRLPGPAFSPTYWKERTAQENQVTTSLYNAFVQADTALKNKVFALQAAGVTEATLTDADAQVLDALDKARTQMLTAYLQNQPQMAPTVPQTGTAPTTGTTGAGGAAAATAQFAPPPRGLPQNLAPWYQQFQTEHGMTPEQYYGQPGQTETGGPGYGAQGGLNEALEDLAWSEQFLQATGKAPSDWDWKQHWYQKTLGYTPNFMYGINENPNAPYSPGQKKAAASWAPPYVTWR